MQGNPYYKEFVSAETWQKSKRTFLGDKDRKVTINSDKDLEPFSKLIEQMQNFLSIKEPQSNYKMPIRNERARAQKEWLEKMASVEADKKEKEAATQKNSKKAETKEGEKQPTKEEKTEKVEKKSKKV